MESADELRVKLAGYGEQLAQVEALLAGDPSNVQILKLKTDLEQVIALTQDLMDVAEPPPAAATAGAAVAAAGVPPPPPLPVEGGGEGSGEAFGIGTRVEALSRDTWYPAVIKQVSSDLQTFTLEYIGFGGEDSKTLAMLRQIRHPPLPVNAADVKRGFKCRGLYLGDMQWYDCVIESKTEHGYKVLFTQYGNREELPLEYLQQKPADAAADPSGGAKPRVLPKSAIAEDGTFKIPDNLRLQSTDTDADKVRKRNKVKALKMLYKQQLVEQETDKKQSSWKAFATSKGTKRVAGSMKGVRKESIFKSPDSLDGKVGVVGSGQGMTDFDNKKRTRGI
eukprot:TRINITY_DN242_c0_g1_i1.p2 TRINITY_DN242_c0_g1~~TRINITY_DN242_c0_g1_i1.p2  ORF type:complete len:336 (-),score=85.48 TRINITY_DN242_c0_g1_i1:35-1042(-)